MKALCFCLLWIVSVNLFAQQFNFPKTTQFYDLPGDHFLSYQVKTGIAIIRENDVNGDLVWVDTLSFSNAVDTIEQVRIAQFGNSSRYVIALQKILYPFPTTLIEYPIIYQFTQFDLTTHTFGTSVVDTVVSRYGAQLFSYNDSAVNVLYYRRPDNINSDNYEVWSLNNQMQLTPLAPYQNTITVPYWNTFDMDQDTIRQYISLTDGIARIEYTPDFHQIPPPQTYFIPYGTFDFVGIHFAQLLNADSLLLFHQATKSGSSLTEWGFTLLNNWLDPISGYTFTAPTSTDSWGSTIYYHVQQAVYKDGLIYVFARLLDNGYHPKIFVYDLDFVFQCEIDVPFYTNDQQFLGLINDQVYFYAYTAQVLNEYCYFKVDNCEFLSTQQIESQNELSVFPNPSDGMVTVQLPESTGSCFLRVINSEGKCVQSYPFEGLTNVKIDIKDSGFYVIEVQLSNMVLRKKLIIQ